MSLAATAYGVRDGRWDRMDIEPRVLKILNHKLELRKRAPYSAKTNAEVSAMLMRVFETQDLRGVEIRDLLRMAGGASKEQFAFTVRHDGDQTGERMVLRMDPFESIAQTCRGREAEIQSKMVGIVPVAPVRFVDADGEILGQPGLITEFVNGVTSPTDLKTRGVSGIGSSYGEWAVKLAPQFVDCLARIHTFDVSKTQFKYFQIPKAGTAQAPIQQVNWWSKVWWDDVVEPVPLVTLTERWLRENAPICDRPVVVHCDFRIGNFMFEEPSGKFTAVLDWELCHLGDFHEDLAWATTRQFGTWGADGKFLVCGLLPREDFLRQYEESSGNTIDPVILRYYEVLNAYKCAVMDLGAAMRAAKLATNHQDIVLSWLGSAGAVFLNQMVRLMREEA